MDKIDRIIIEIVLKIIIIGISIIIYYIFRYTDYNSLRYLNANEYNKPLNRDFDLYYQSLDKNNKTIECDYEKMEFSFFDNFNGGWLREFPSSHSMDSIIRLANIKDGYNILDAGCGTGMCSIYLCKKLPNLKCTLIVNSNNLFTIATNNIKKHNMTNRISIFFMDFDRIILPVTNMRFDLILFLETIDYSLDRNKLLKNIKPLLKPTGHIFIKTPIFKDTLVIDNKSKKLIDIWKYNFSTLSSFLYDLSNNNYKNVKYINMPVYKSALHVNLIDLMHCLKFVIINKIKINDNIFGVISCDELYILAGI
jgi:ubiquinone/menaquinone biosynthesis C-methylase UbiE